MGKVAAIAMNTFREAIRNKVLYALLVFAVLLIMASIVVARLSLHEEIRVVQDLGLMALSLFGVLIAVFIGVNLVYKELDKKTVYFLIPKPLHRFQFLLGKYVGTLLTMAILTSVMAFVLLAVIGFMGARPKVVVAQAIWFYFIEIIVVSAIALFFSSFSTPFVSGLLTLMVFVLGRSTMEIRELLNRMQDTLLGDCVRLVMAVAPDLNLFNVSGAVAQGRHVSIHTTFVTWTYVGQATAYGLLYSAIVLVLAMLIFRRRDFM